MNKNSGGRHKKAVMQEGFSGCKRNPDTNLLKAKVDVKVEGTNVKGETEHAQVVIRKTMIKK
jgi:hypothetical protein